jgi:hypothetical protein
VEGIWKLTPMGRTGLLCDRLVIQHLLQLQALGLGNVANTAPSGLPISNAVSSAMTLKANLSGANFTGNITGTTIHASTSLLVGGTNLTDIYLRTNNFNTTIGNYILNTNFNTTIGNYVLSTGIQYNYWKLYFKYKF